jgi:OPA family glycerol-3-phosphate transporter-like MFS transporter 1/2
MAWLLRTRRWCAVALTFFCYAVYSGVRQATSITKETLETTYAPFDDADWGTLFLGLVDFVYLVSYAVWQFAVTKMVMRWTPNLAHVAAIGLGGSGVCLILVGVGGSASVHSLAYFLIFHAIHGAFQACGWIACLTITIRWLDPHYRLALALGVWNAHASVGSIVVKVLGSRLLLAQWEWTGVYYGLGALTLASAVLVWVCLDETGAAETASPPTAITFDRVPMSPGLVVQSPLASSDVEQSPSPRESCSLQPPPPPYTHTSSSPSLSPCPSPSDVTILVYPDVPAKPSLSWTSSKVLVWRVTSYCVCYFFAKIVANLFSGWLPFYLGSRYTETSTATAISTMYDVGGVLGGIGGGFVCDYYKKRRTSTTSFICFVSCAPLLGLFIVIQSQSNAWASGFWMLLIGIAVQTPCSLVSSVVVADLGRESLHDPRALAAMTGLVNGAGSIGSALQAIIVSLAAPSVGWDNIFYGLVCCSILASLPLLPSTWREIKRR